MSFEHYEILRKAGWCLLSFIYFTSGVVQRCPLFFVFINTINVFICLSSVQQHRQETLNLMSVVNSGRFTICLGSVCAQEPAIGDFSRYLSVISVLMNILNLMNCKAISAKTHMYILFGLFQVKVVSSTTETFSSSSSLNRSHFSGRPAFHAFRKSFSIAYVLYVVTFEAFFLWINLQLSFN